MRDNFAHLALVPSDAVEARTANKAILAVGEPGEWAQKGNDLPDNEDMIFVAYDEVTEKNLHFYQPSLIVSPALSPVFDCIELAMLLRNIGYKGAYRAVVRDLPKPELIEREVNSACPLLDFGILIVE